MGGMDTGVFDAITNNDEGVKCRWHQANIKELQNTVYGNGRDGLVTSVTKLREHVKLLLWLNGIVASATVAAVVIGMIKMLLAKP